MEGLIEAVASQDNEAIQPQHFVVAYAQPPRVSLVLPH